MATRSNFDIETVAIEALEKAVMFGHIDTRREQAETVSERLYLLLNQYTEENAELKLKLQTAEAEIKMLRAVIKAFTI